MGRRPAAEFRSELYEPGSPQLPFDVAEQEQEHGARLGKTLADYPAQLNPALDLEKNETQAAPPAEYDIGLAGDIPRGPSIPPTRTDSA